MLLVGTGTEMFLLLEVVQLKALLTVTLKVIVPLAGAV